MLGELDAIAPLFYVFLGSNSFHLRFFYLHELSPSCLEPEQDLESSFMMLQNSGREWLECKPLPITLQSKGRVERLRMGMNMEISTQPSPKLGESRKELYFSKPDLILPGLNIGKLNC